MNCSLDTYRAAIGRFCGILIKILGKKALTAAKRRKVLHTHRMISVLALTTLLAMLCIGGIEKNPGPLTYCEQTQPSSARTNEVLDNGDNTTKNFERIFTAINHLSRTVTQLSEQVTDSVKFQSDMAKRIDERLDDMQLRMSKRLEEVEENQNILRLDIDEVSERSVSLDSRMTVLQNKVHDLEQKVESTENLSRRFNLLFFGIPRTVNETLQECENKLREIIQNNMKLPDTITFERVKRIGSAVLVQFQSLNLRNEVLRQGRQLAANQPSVYVRPDYTEKVRQRRSCLAPLMKQIRSDGKRAHLQNDKLVTDDGIFIFDLQNEQIEKLPARKQMANRPYVSNNLPDNTIKPRSSNTPRQMTRTQNREKFTQHGSGVDVCYEGKAKMRLNMDRLENHQSASHVVERYETRCQSTSEFENSYPPLLRKQRSCLHDKDREDTRSSQSPTTMDHCSPRAMPPSRSEYASTAPLTHSAGNNQEKRSPRKNEISCDGDKQEDISTKMPSDDWQ